MSGEMAAALVGGSASLVGALIGGFGAWKAASSAAKATGVKALEAALETSRRNHMAVLEQAHRAARRAVYGSLLGKAQEFSRDASTALDSLEKLEMAMEIEWGGYANPGDWELDNEEREPYGQFMPAVRGLDPLKNAALHAELEGPGDVRKAARELSVSAEALGGFWIQAWEFCENEELGISLEPPAYSGMKDAWECLGVKVRDFVRVAAAHLDERV
ncbi:hypothetical protein OHA98_00385 [Streptomyces sp. NBC_00654]|uniref:hypothetical protein n=1 Tax=Streptomyces sp. NBC_00654 TaxID=2975799 RepID=UPI0022571FAE|nr:hypothetical protein [Streptomyces sp. NBC_00654]MCX4963292.1 hypothetical protein [Streptomyces sp. NBC_00654]